MKNKAVINLQRRLERMELEHLRRHAFELHERLERAESAASLAEESAEFWQRHAMNLQEAIHDADFATHRCIGINNSGELMVVRNDQQRGHPL